MMNCITVVTQIEYECLEVSMTTIMELMVLLDCEQHN